MSPRLRRRRAISLLLLTLVVPGSAQLVAGNRTLGRLGLRSWLAIMSVAVLAGLLALASRSLALGLFSRSWFLTLLQWALIGFAALWALLFADAWRLGRPASLVRRGRRVVGGLTAALMLIPGGLLYAGTSVAAGKNALNALFRENRAVEATDGRYNVLLLGGDSGKNRVGTRPDSLQLVSVDQETGRAVTFGFSRDTENINFREGSLMRRIMPEGWNCGDECLLNGLYTWAEDHRDQFPSTVREPGIEATRQAVEALSGLDVHYYVLVDLTGFRRLVDAVGGLEVNVQKRTPIGGGTSRISGWIEPGRQHLDGYHALWYARSREGSTNYERMARQRCVMTAMAEQLDPQTVLLKFRDIAGASTGLIRTDLPQSELGFFADLVLKARSQKIKSVNFVPPLIKPWDYDATFVHRTVESTIAASEKSREKARKPAPKAAGAVAKPKPAPQVKTSPSASAAAPTAAQGRATESDLSSVCSAS